MERRRLEKREGGGGGIRKREKVQEREIRLGGNGDMGKWKAPLPLNSKIIREKEKEEREKGGRNLLLLTC